MCSGVNIIHLKKKNVKKNNYEKATLTQHFRETPVDLSVCVSTSFAHRETELLK